MFIISRPTLCRSTFWLVGSYILAASPVPCHGALLSFTFHDMAGDPRDNTDVTEVSVQFDNQTGDFDIKVTTDAENSFDGNHLLYLSVFDPDVGTTDPESSFLNLVRFGFSAETPTTMLSRSGNSSVLTHWSAGDRVASYDVLGVPDNRTDFHSVLGGNRQGFDNSDEILDQAIIRTIPEPTARVLIAIGITLIWIGVSIHRPGARLRS